jgi:hypothetical protein
MLGWKSLLRESRLFGGFANNDCKKSYKIGAWAEGTTFYLTHTAQKFENKISSFPESNVQILK